MIKTLTNILKQDKEKFAVPRKVQDIIPVRSIWPDGIFLTGKNKFSKMYRFTDINYAVASREDKEGMFLGYSELLNSLDSGCTAKITINNRRLNMLDFEDRILLRLMGDKLDVYRKEYNDMLTDKAIGSNAIIQDEYSLALELELFTRGSLNTFAKQTNVDTSNRLICYDILELGEQLRAIGMLVILDSILNRITQNRQRGKQTYIIIDEIYLLFMHEYSAQFLYKLWKRVRKYGAFCTGITQNVADLLQSYTARTMLSNSEFIVMLNQAATDRIELAKLLNISNEQLSYITNVDAGHGLLKVGSSLVPFENKFPKDTQLYKLMTSKPGEGFFAGDGTTTSISADKVRNSSDEQEILRKIREVAMNNADFDEMIKRYMSQAGS